MTIFHMAKLEDVYHGKKCSVIETESNRVRKFLAFKTNYGN
jgi:hypothetical protein